jgi:hypothetical protein
MVFMGVAEWGEVLYQFGGPQITVDLDYNTEGWELLPVGGYRLNPRDTTGKKVVRATGMEGSWLVVRDRTRML